MTHRQNRLDKLRNDIRAGRYQADPQRIAIAIITRAIGRLSHPHATLRGPLALADLPRC